MPSSRENPDLASQDVEGDGTTESRLDEVEDSKPLKLGPVRRFQGENLEFIEGLKAMADDYLLRNFGQMVSAVDRILGKVREKDPQEEGGWKRSPDGGYVEDYSRLDVSDLEAAILSLSLEAYFGSIKLDDLYLEASFAKYILDDEYSSEYLKVEASLKVDDRKAQTALKTRQTRYQAFARSYLYYRIRDFLREADTLARRIETIRKSRVDDMVHWHRGNKVSK